MGRDCASEHVPIALAEGRPEAPRAQASPDERRRRRRTTSSALAIGSAMPRDGSIRLSDVETPFLDVVCAPCGRRGRYAVARLTVLGDTTINRRNGQ
jgi:hypothetical protein